MDEISSNQDHSEISSLRIDNLEFKFLNPKKIFVSMQAIENLRSHFKYESSKMENQRFIFIKRRQQISQRAIHRQQNRKPQQPLQQRSQFRLQAHQW